MNAKQPDAGTRVDDPDEAGSAKTRTQQQGSAPPAGPADLGALLEGLRTEQDGLTASIKLGKAALAGQEGRQQNLKKEVTDLDRVASDLERGRTDADVLLAEVEEALKAARPLVDQLDEKVWTEVDDAIIALDDAIAKAAEAERTARDTLTQRTSEHETAVRDVTGKQAVFDAALAALAGLTAAIKAKAGVLRTQRTALTAATKGGQDRRAYVLVVEVTAHRDALEELRGADHEKQLVGRLHTATTELASARKAANEALAAVTAQQEEVDRRAAAHKELVAARPAAIEKLAAGSRDAALAAPAARGR